MNLSSFSFLFTKRDSHLLNFHLYIFKFIILKNISRTVWILSFVSLFTDISSEMLYPITPFYLKSIGFSIFIIGILEGIAEAVSGLSKGYFGKQSDLSGKRLPFVRLGYTLSALSKPLMILFISPIWVLLVRATDRLGKGIRTGARDAMLSDESTPSTKAKVFGLHRSLDTFGAVLGPSIALIYLYFYPSDYKTLFLIAFLPGVIAIATTFLLKEKLRPLTETKSQNSFLSFLSYWKSSPTAYRQLVAGLLFFALFNSSDVFLLLKVKEVGIDDTQAIMLYIFYNLIYALFAFPLGILADKIGLKKIFIAGLILFAIVYFGMSFSHSISIYIALFFIYGIYAAATEGIAKAWISNIAPTTQTATAIGTYTALQSLATLLASSLTGWVWYHFGASIAFLITAIATVLLILYFTFFARLSTSLEL